MTARTIAQALTVTAITPDRFVCVAGDAHGKCQAPAIVKVNAEPLCQYHAWDTIDQTAAVLRHRVQTLAALMKEGAGRLPSQVRLVIPKHVEPMPGPSPAVWLGGDREF